MAVVDELEDGEATPPMPDGGEAVPDPPAAEVEGWDEAVDEAQAAADQAAAVADAAAAAAGEATDAVIDAIEAANGKNKITRAADAPPTDYEGAPGDTWWTMTTLDPDGSVIAQHRWDGSAWVPERIDSEVLAYVDAAKITSGYLDAARIEAGSIYADKIASGAIETQHLKAGAVTTEKLTVTEDMSAAIVDAMSVNAKKLVVTEEAILNHATLIGDTVVDDINVQGKLIGTDGVFTGTVDFENINVTDEVLASRISGEYIYGTVIEGGEVRTGTDESRGSFLLGDEAYVNPEDGYVAPGLRFTPP